MQQELDFQSYGALAHVEGLREGVLRFQRCTSCGHPQTLARYACSACGKSTLVWEESTARGKVVATTTVTRAPSEAFAALTPYVLVIVELDEGPRVMGHAAAGLYIGDRVAATYFAHGERTLLRFVALEG
jgi:uncharacterized protein